MKLIALYTVFNGLELLKDSIDNIKDHVDEIIVCYQDVSNKGEKSYKVAEFCYKLASDKILVAKFIPDLKFNTKRNEMNKHNFMLQIAKVRGATHYILMATDHFYKPSEFSRAKEVCEIMDYDVTFTDMYTYYKHPVWQLFPIENYSMPFICKMLPETQFERVPQYPVKVDPSIQVNTCGKWYKFNEKDIMMHHYSMIRDDIENKFRNAAASIRWSPEQIEAFKDQYYNYDLKINPGIKYFQGRKVRIVDDFFDLNNP